MRCDRDGGEVEGRDMGSCFAHDDNGYSIEHRSQEVLYGQQRQLLA